jgi:ArsR family transcriptional regulator, arsenate/arsenite/antimonite-responsive transcriptional repressor
MDAQMDELAKVAEALGDPLRARILDLLASGRLNACCSPANPEAPAAVCACDLSADLGGLAPSKLAYHLARLRAVGLVHERRRGKWVYYSINREALAGLCQKLLSRWTSGACCATSRPAKAPVAEKPSSKRRPQTSGRRSSI